ncbi:MAG: AAA family ATPase [Pseudomonadota bacterium]
MRVTIEAFSAQGPTRAAFEQAAKDPRLIRSRVGVHDGGLAGAIAYFRENPSPQVIIVEEAGGDAELMAHLGSLAEVVEPGVKVIIVGALNDVSLYRTLIGQGVSEYLVAPPSPDQVVETVLGIYRDPASAPRGRVIAFFGARGGVGSSSIAHNVAWLLARTFKETTILADLDFSFGSADLAYNIEIKQPAYDVVAQSDRLDDVLFDKCLVPAGDNLKVLANTGNLSLAAAPPSEALDKILDLARGVAGFVVLDLPHVWAEWTQAALEIAEDVVIVAQPDLTGLRESKNILAVLTGRRGANPTRLLLNKTGESKKTELSAKDFMEAANIHTVLTVPYAPEVFGNALNNGQMIGEVAKTHAVAESLRKIAAQVSGRELKAEKPGGKLDVLGWLRSGKKKDDKIAAKPKLAE